MNIPISLPEELVRRAELLARHEGVSVDIFVANRLKDQLADLEYLESRAARSTEGRFRAALAQIPDKPPQHKDRLMSE
jgi:hypothetical protein